MPNTLLQCKLWRGICTSKVLDNQLDDSIPKMRTRNLAKQFHCSGLVKNLPPSLWVDGAWQKYLAWLQLVVQMPHTSGGIVRMGCLMHIPPQWGHAKNALTQEGLIDGALLGQEEIFFPRKQRKTVIGDELGLAMRLVMASCLSTWLEEEMTICLPSMINARWVAGPL